MKKEYLTSRSNLG